MLIQEDKALKASAQCPLPLYIKLVMTDLQICHSYDINVWENLPPDSLEGLLTYPISILPAGIALMYMQDYVRTFLSH